MYIYIFTDLQATQINIIKYKNITRIIRFVAIFFELLYRKLSSSLRKKRRRNTTNNKFT